MQKKGILLLILFLSVCTQAWSTHLRAGEIRVRQTDCTSLTFQITIVVYTNFLNTGVLFGGDDATLSFGDGTSQLVPEIKNVEVIDAALGIGRVTYVTTHQYARAGMFVIGYVETNRNDGVLNMDRAPTTPFYIETGIEVKAGVCNSSPYILVPPIDRACRGITFYHNPGAVDEEGDSLTYEQVVPRRSATSIVENYLLPNHQNFYSAAGIPYNTANEEKTGPPVFVIDRISGTLTWNAPGSVGEYTAAIKIIEWKFNTTEGSWYQAGYVIRDMQIIVEECNNKKPALALPTELCVVAGTRINFTAAGSDPDGHPVSIDAFSDAFQIAGNRPQVAPASGTVQSAAPSVQFTWQTQCSHTRTQPYRIIFKISDHPPTGPRLIQFYTLNIKVIAPAPEYDNTTINPISKQVTLNWKNYPCDNLQSMQVWKRVSQFNYIQPECSSGMPASLHYQLLAEVPAGTNTYTDKELAIGAQYCYRLVALVGPSKVPGRISLDTCFVPQPAKAPVITNVSVNTTDPQSGSIDIRWTTPFEIDKVQYPSPYLYKVHRRIFGSDAAFEVISPDAVADTSFVDVHANTKEVTYEYRVELFVPALTTLPVDTSSQASSVFLTTKSLPNSIELKWTAGTPWSNFTQSDPYHQIYRSDHGTAGPFVLIDSVEVNQSDLLYVDHGQSGNAALMKDKHYHYKVLTRGAYGNPKIKTPLENYSQISGSETLDVDPPCTPQVTLLPTDCSEFSCDEASYYNRMSWSDPVGECGNDVVYYEILVSEGPENDFAALAVVTSNSFLHDKLESLSKCYRVVAVDDAGNKSDSSTVVCGANCINFEMPNVITPGVSETKNDFLTYYSFEAGNTSKCARSVKMVKVKIYDRWGDIVFTRSLNSEADKNLWNGVNDAGQEVSAGIYYYSAQVTFKSAEADGKRQQFNGWVQVIR